MPSVAEGNLTFEFPDGWEVSKPDEWSFYRNQFQSVCPGTKAVDILAVEPGQGCAWYIEIKDYRRHARSKTEHVADETACKVRDSLALVAAAGVNANDHDEEHKPCTPCDAGGSGWCSISSSPQSPPNCSRARSTWPTPSRSSGSGSGPSTRTRLPVRWT